MKSFYVILACAHALIATARLWRAYTGTTPNWLVTLSNAGAATLSKKQRRADTLFGLCYLAFAISFLFIASIQRP